MKKNVKIEDISKDVDQLTHVDPEDLPPLPEPYSDPENIPDWAPLKDTARESYECSLDDTIAVSIPKPGWRFPLCSPPYSPPSAAPRIPHALA